MEDFDYTKAPSQVIFNDIKRSATKIWKTYDDTYGYQSEKIGMIKGLKNVRDNYWMMIGMFDSINQRKLLTLVKPETAVFIIKALGQ